MSDINNQQQTKQEEIVTDEFTLFVGGLTPLTTKETLMSYFSKFGSITDVNLITDWVTSQSKCCAIIFCENSKTVNAILKVKAHLIDKKKVRVNTADVKKKGTKIIKTSKIFLGQVHPSITRTDLYDYFSDFGKIKHLRLMHNTYVPLKYSQNGYLEFYF
jgi:RNA recognition motif-containing protein